MDVHVDTDHMFRISAVSWKPTYSIQICFKTQTKYFPDMSVMFNFIKMAGFIFVLCHAKRSLMA